MIDYTDYGTKLTKPQEIADVERVPLSKVVSDLAAESGKDYYQAFANTIIFLRTTLLTKINSDPEDIKLLKNLDEIEKAARIPNRGKSQEANEDALSLLFHKLGTSNVEESLFAIDLLLQK